MPVESNKSHLLHVLSLCSGVFIWSAVHKKSEFIGLISIFPKDLAQRINTNIECQVSDSKNKVPHKHRKRQHCVLAADSGFYCSILKLFFTFCSCCSVTQRAVVGFISTRKRHIKRTNAAILLRTRPFLHLNVHCLFIQLNICIFPFHCADDQLH